MEDKSCTSSEAGQHLLMPNVQLAQPWTKSLKHMPNFTHTHIEKQKDQMYKRSQPLSFRYTDPPLKILKVK